MRQHIVATAITFSCQNNPFFINDAPLFKVVAFIVALFNVALFNLALFEAVMFDVTLF